MKRKTRSIQGAISYLRRPVQLRLLEDKPWAYKMQPVRGNVIKDDEIVAYAAQAAHVPETAILVAKNGLFDAINFYVTQGMGVKVPGLGSFAPITRTKVQETAAEVNADSIVGRIIRFYPKEEVARLARFDNITFVENKTLSQMACGLVWVGTGAAARLGTIDGKIAVFDKGGAGNLMAYTKAGAFEPAGITAENKDNFIYVVKVGTEGTTTTWAYGSHFYHETEGSITDLPGYLV